MALCDLGDFDIALLVLGEVSPYDVVRSVLGNAICHGSRCRRVPGPLLPSGCSGVCFPESDAYWIEFGSLERHVDFPESSVAFLHTLFVPAGCNNASGSHYEIVAVGFVDPPGYISGEVALVELVQLCEAFVGRRSRARDVLRDRDCQQAQGDSLAAEVSAFASFLKFVHLISFVWQRGDFDHIHESASFGAESVNPLCGTDEVI